MTGDTHLVVYPAGSEAKQPAMKSEDVNHCKGCESNLQYGSPPAPTCWQGQPSVPLAASHAMCVQQHTAA